MYVAGSIIHVVLFVFIALMWVRFIVDWVMVFARQWQPTGPLLVVLVIFFPRGVVGPFLTWRGRRLAAAHETAQKESASEKKSQPNKALRKVIPPLRLGNFALDLSFLLVLVIAWVLLNVNDSLLLS